MNYICSSFVCDRISLKLLHQPSPISKFTRGPSNTYLCFQSLFRSWIGHISAKIHTIISIQQHWLAKSISIRYSFKTPNCYDRITMKRREMHACMRHEKRDDCCDKHIENDGKTIFEFNRKSSIKRALIKSEQTALAFSWAKTMLFRLKLAQNPFERAHFKAFQTHTVSLDPICFDRWNWEFCVECLFTLHRARSKHNIRSCE